MDNNDNNRDLSLRRPGSEKKLESEFFDTSTLSNEDRSMASELEEAEYEDSGFGEADEGYQYGFSKKKAKAKKSQGFSRKKHTKIRVLAGTIAGLVGVVVGVIFFALWYKDYLLNQITYETTDANAVITIIDENGNTVLLNNVTQTTRFAPVQDQSIVNYLLIGIDSREKYYNESGTGERSDVIVVMSIDKKQGTIKLISVARDSYAQFPGYDNFYKINASMSWGGPDLLVATVEKCLRINIDGYAYVNFIHMADIVDAVGGVYVNMTSGEVDVANDYIKEMDPNATPITNYGEHTWISGIQAVAYARIRYVGNGDFERMERQIEVLRSVMNQYMALSATGKLAAMDNVLQAIVTDIPKEQIESLAFEFLPSMQNLEMMYLQLPIEGTYNAGIYGDEWSERINWNALVPYVQLYLYGRTQEFDEVPIPNYAPDLEDCETDIPLDQLVH